MFWNAREIPLGIVLGKILGKTMKKEKDKRNRTNSTIIAKQKGAQLRKRLKLSKILKAFTRKSSLV